MKLPSFLSKFLQKKPQTQEVFLSLILDDTSVSAAAWSAKSKGLPSVVKTVTKPLKNDSWDERVAVADEAVATLDEAVAPALIGKVVLGLPATYLSPDGEILPEIRQEIKNLTKTLELTPIGFVPVHQAIAHTLKHDEGVPPTVILLGVGKTLTISLFKVGTLVGQKIVPLVDEVADATEKVLKSFNIEILPSRMLLYGGNHDQLSDVQAKLLRHQWPTRANFLHFPKIELEPVDFAVGAVCVAGATELSKAMGEDPEVAASVAANIPVPLPTAVVEVEASKDIEIPTEEVFQEEAVPVTAREEIETTAQDSLTDSNVEMVNPEELGFARDASTSIAADEEVTASETAPEQSKKKFNLPNIAIPAFHFPKLGSIPGKGIGLAIGVVVLLVLGAYLARWAIPRAQVTVLTLPQQVSADGSITIEPSATVVSSEERIIPARTQEKSVSGQSSIAATGKKKVGDPAKGAVTVFNKSTSSRSLKKGGVIIANALQFSLDEDISVASASENLVSGTITFGKANASVTAVEIGPQSNLPAATEFTFKDIATSIAIARNDKALAGGTSRDVTVISRADQDAMTKDLTTELVEKAKAELKLSVDPSEKLIEETIKTTVTSKEFSQEVNQEASQLQGQLTITVTGISYSEEDVKTLLRENVSAKIPEGYTLDEATLTSTISKVSVAKDGTITVNASLAGNAIPGVDVATIQQTIAGKSLAEAQEVLKGMKGIAGAEFLFRFAFSKNKLPVNKNNISVLVAAQ